MIDPLEIVLDVARETSRPWREVSKWRKVWRGLVIALLLAGLGLLIWLWIHESKANGSK